MVSYGINILWKPLEPLKLLILVTSRQVIIKDIRLPKNLVWVSFLLFLELSDRRQVFVFSGLID